MLSANTKYDLPDGMNYYPNKFSLEQQQALLHEIREKIRQAPLYQPQIPGGGIMSVRMTNFGSVGWVSDRKGYRYQAAHPITGKDWPSIPKCLLELWQELTERKDQPDCCLCNFYDSQAKMGMHQDKDEADFNAPVLSVSLGDPGLFAYSPTRQKRQGGKLWLYSGDVLIFGGKSRLYFHGIDKIDLGAGPVNLLNNQGRVNLTLRKL